MLSEFSNAIARCCDCLNEITGELAIDDSDTKVNEARGNLVVACDAHHDSKRIPNTEGADHDEFFIEVSEESIGILGPVSSKAAVVKFTHK